MTEDGRLKIAVFTLGCKVNLYDSDSMLAIFKQAGFDVAEGLSEADVYVLNTCAVTAEAEKKSRQAIARIRKLSPNAEIYVCGCASQNDPTQFKKQGVVYVGGSDGKQELARYIVQRHSAENADIPKDVCALGNFDISNVYGDGEGVLNLRTRHFIKIQDGCNNFCSYCIIPYLRGRSRSRSAESIKRELDSIKDGVKEVVVTGINLSAYGLDIGTSLAKLVRSLSDYDMRFRLGSLEVGVIDRELLEATKALKHFCPHFHLSLQSGSDSVLKAMNRHYSAEEFKNAVALIREYYQNAAITTDIIVGFPAETEENFLQSMAFAREIGFADIHVFPYSSRKGTVAGKLKPLPPEVVEDRQKRMSEVKRELSSMYLTESLDLPQEVVFETCEDGVWQGHSQYYVKVYSKQGMRNEVRTVLPTRLYSDGVCDF